MRIALIAHDELKDEMVAFVRSHADVLGDHELVTTGTTGTRIADETRLAVNPQASGPLGGDLELRDNEPTGTVVSVRVPRLSVPADDSNTVRTNPE